MIYIYIYILGYHCGYSMFNCQRNLYDNDCWRNDYRDRLFNLVLKNHLLPSFRGAGSRIIVVIIIDN